MNFMDKVYQRQAEIISERNAHILTLQHRLNEFEICGQFYKGLADAIGDNIMLQDEWRRFISILRLNNPDIPGITKELSRYND